MTELEKTPTTELVGLETKKNRGRPRKDTTSHGMVSDVVLDKTSYKSVGGTFTVVLDVYYGKTKDKVEVQKVEFFKDKQSISMGYMVAKKGRKRVVGLIKKAMWKAKVRDFSLSFDLQAVLEQE